MGAAMNRAQAIESIRARLRVGQSSIGSWIQIPHGSIAEIMGAAGYDWVALDLEHGSIALHELPDLCRALELGGTLPLARVAEGSPKDCKQALDAGCGGIIAPMIESAGQLKRIRDACRWPPAGRRGVGFARANLFGERFDEYAREAQEPLLIAMIEHGNAVEHLPEIVEVEGLDAILVGPYDLSASLGRTAQFTHPEFEATMARILDVSRAARVPCGVHVVAPSPEELARREAAGYRFIAYGIDSVILRQGARRPA
jgi:2-dehydro-3-deoxyglucarate aldolase